MGYMDQPSPNMDHAFRNILLIKKWKNKIKWHIVFRKCVLHFFNFFPLKYILIVGYFIACYANMDHFEMQSLRGPYSPPSCPILAAGPYYQHMTICLTVLLLQNPCPILTSKKWSILASFHFSLRWPSFHIWKG